MIQVKITRSPIIVHRSQDKLTATTAVMDINKIQLFVYTSCLSFKMSYGNGMPMTNQVKWAISHFTMAPKMWTECFTRVFWCFYLSSL